MLWGLLHSLTRSAVKKPGVLIQVIVASIGAFAAPILANMIAKPAQCDSDQTVKITCPLSATPTVDRDRVCVSPGYHVIWDLPPSARVQTHDFKKRAFGSGDGFGTWIHADPVNQSTYDNGGTQNQLTALVKGGVEGRNYKYSVSCIQNGTWTLDPMIDVPPRRLVLFGVTLY